MPMLLIKGSYHLVNGRPDGDTIQFVADEKEEWNLVPGPHKVKRNGSGKAKLRLDAIDTLETHYAREGNPEVHQPWLHGRAARDELTKWLGFTTVERAPDETVTAATPTTRPGWILTRGAGRDKRCIALAGKGTPPGTSGTWINVDEALLRTTFNHHVLLAGLAYPTYYTNLFPDLRDELTAAVRQAQEEEKGLWRDDDTLDGATVTGIDSLQDDVVILPKLFRRLVDYLYLGDPDNPDLTGFPAFLDEAADEFWIISTSHPTTGLDAVVEVIDGKVRMTHPPEDLVFVEN
ncbi:thermonuclease family protein [Streptomyces sp. NK15101]|uniref:thermonuclease family protein n=1 Tax=Streptomyces sp. NK15101 TaxID=2873261 RepID=UPI001CEC3872|nr:thermonuclease family protein [Streptomyces sp. NK15101]